MISVEEVLVRPLKEIRDHRGTVRHMLRSDDPWFEQFGEIYFSTAYPGVVKGWHRHTKMTLNYVWVYGKIKLVVFDGVRFKEFFLDGETKYSLITIPPMLWNGFKNIGKTDCMIANCSDIPHDPEEIERLDPELPIVEGIPYTW